MGFTIDTFKNAIAITPHDSNALAHGVNAIYVGGAGAIKADLTGTGEAITFAAIPVGTLLRISADKIYSTGTTATNLIGLY